MCVCVYVCVYVLYNGNMIQVFTVSVTQCVNQPPVRVCVCKLSPCVLGVSSAAGGDMNQ